VFGNAECTVSIARMNQAVAERGARAGRAK